MNGCDDIANGCGGGRRGEGGIWFESGERNKLEFKALFMHFLYTHEHEHSLLSLMRDRMPSPFS